MSSVINSTAEVKPILKTGSTANIVDSWFLMSSPLPVLLIWVAYIIFVLKLGPGLMKKRSAFKLNNVLLLYNAIQVLISLYILKIGGALLWQYGFISTSCLRADREYAEIQINTGSYYYFAAKVTELLDTIFFVLRKNQRQITFLHVYHHSLMMLSVWVFLKYDPTSCNYFIGTLNSFVHVIMYTYYGLAAFPGLRKYLWWKKYITTMQIVQFMLMLVHIAVNYAYSKCPVSRISIFMASFNALLFIYLFADFYVKSYNNSLSKGTKTEYHIKIHHHGKSDGKCEKVQ